MSEHAVADRVRELLRDVLSGEPPTPETDLIDSGLLDSLSLVELLFALEQEFQLSIPLDNLELDAFRTIDSIASFVEAQRAQAA
jgi:acyl carrier protein